MSLDLRQLQHISYLASRGIGDARAAQRGPAVLARRLTRRTITRRLAAALNSNGQNR